MTICLFQNWEMFNFPRMVSKKQHPPYQLFSFEYSMHHQLIMDQALVWRGLAWPPSRNPLRKRRRTNFRWRARPVPVVFLRLAFSDQLSVWMGDQIKFRSVVTHELLQEYSKICWIIWYEHCIVIVRPPKYRTLHGFVFHQELIK